MTKKLLIYFFLLFSAFSVKAQFEVNYPEFLGDGVGDTLPSYVIYIFNFSVIIVGLIIFGSLIYGGFLYITSFGDPGKFQIAKKRILSAFLGAAILLSAFLVFNIIDPTLINIDPGQVDPVSSQMEPGFYICERGGNNNADINDLHVRISAYTILSQQIINQLIEGGYEYQDRKDLFDQRDTQKDAILTITGQHNCRRLSSSLPTPAALRFTITRTSIIYFIPVVRQPTPEERDEGQTTAIAEFPYGLIFHSVHNFQRRCRILDNVFMGSVPMHSYVLNNWPLWENWFGYERQIRAITLFEKTEPNLNNYVTLYSNINHDDPRFHSDEEKKIDFYLRTGIEAANNFLGYQDYGLDRNLRSIKFSGSNIFVVISSNAKRTGSWVPGMNEAFYEDELTFCGVINQDIYNLSGHPAIGTICYGAQRLHGTDTIYQHQEEQVSEGRGGPCARRIQLIDGIIL